jgi:hypothetical protein
MAISKIMNFKCIDLKQAQMHDLHIHLLNETVDMHKLIDGCNG